MNLTELFSNEEMTAAAKLEGIAEVVASAKKAYGNEDSEIGEPAIPSTDGFTAISMISPEGKVELAKAEVACIKANAYEDSQTDGVVFNKRIEEYLAISPVLTHITATVDSEYL